MPTHTTMTGPDVVRYLASFRMPCGQEVEFQDTVAEVLDRAGLAYEREYDLGPGVGRIDFYMRAPRLGLELEFVCPASDEAGHRTTCQRCALCRGQQSPARSVAIYVHGKPSSLRAFGLTRRQLDEWTMRDAR